MYRHHNVYDIVHIMKALTSGPRATQNLIEDDSLHLLFQVRFSHNLCQF